MEHITKKGWILCSDGEEHEYLKDEWERWLHYRQKVKYPERRFFIRIRQEGNEDEDNEEHQRSYSYGIHSANLACCVAAARHKRYFSFKKTWYRQRKAHYE